MDHLTAPVDPPGIEMRHRSRRVPIRAALTAVGVAGFVWVLMAWTWLGSGRLLVVLLLVLAVPTSRELARRVLYAGCVGFGLAPFLWWWHFSLGGVPRLGVLAAVVAAALAGWVAWPSSPSKRLRLLVPRIRPSDVSGALALAVPVAAFLPLLRVRSGTSALSMLAVGFDHAAHFDVVEMLRRHGEGIPSLDAGPLGPWVLSDYVFGYHGAVAALMEFALGVHVAGPDAEIVSYARSMAIVVLAALALVVAGLCGLPGVRRRPLLAGLVSLTAVTAFTLGPGGGALLAGGFPNFIVATALTACVPLLVIPMTRVYEPFPALALGCAVVGVAHSWALLVLLAVAGGAVALTPLRVTRWPRSPGSRARTGLVVSLTCAGTVAAVGILPVRGASELLAANGGFAPATKIEVFLPVLLALLAGFVALVLRDAPGTRDPGDLLQRSFWSALVAGAGVLVAVLLAIHRQSAGGEPSYYFWKFATGLQLFSIVLCCAVAAVLLGFARDGGTFSIKRAAPPALLLVSVALLAVGALRGGPFGGTPSALPGLETRGYWTSAHQMNGETVSAVLAAANLDAGPGPTFLVPTLDGEYNFPTLMNLWLLAFDGAMAEPTRGVLYEIWGDREIDQAREGADVAAARTIVREVPDARVVVEPGAFDRIRREGLAEGWGDRVVTW